MTADVITVGRDASLKEAARRMIEAEVSGLAVTDDEGLAGVITEADFVKSESDRRPKKRARVLSWFSHDVEVPHFERLVGDVMTSNVVTISPETDHAEAARLMQTKRIKRLPVVYDGELIGIVSRSDILRAFARPDESIIGELQDHVMRKVLWIDPKRVTVHVVEGNVVLEGQLETKSDAVLLEDLAGRLDGVVSVKSRLTWEVDNTKLEMVSPPPGIPPHGNWA
jgi:CBS-domain-containing membrane protein